MPGLFACTLVLGFFAPAGVRAQSTPPVRAQSAPPVLLQPGDELVMRVWPDSTLSGRFPVEADGLAYFPVVGAVQVTGHPAREIREELIDGFSNYMRSPIVVLTPRFRVSLLGAVNGPGLHWAEPTMTLMDLILRTGGLPRTADPAKIRLIRGQQVYQVDARAALESGAPTADVPLRSADRIVVPERGGFSFRGFARDILLTANFVFLILNLGRRF